MPSGPGDFLLPISNNAVLISPVEKGLSSSELSLLVISGCITSSNLQSFSLLIVDAWNRVL